MYIVLCSNKGDWYHQLMRYVHLKITAILWKKHYQKKYDYVRIIKENKPWK